MRRECMTTMKTKELCAQVLRQLSQLDAATDAQRREMEPALSETVAELAEQLDMSTDQVAEVIQDFRESGGLPFPTEEQKPALLAEQLEAAAQEDKS
jgi:hypothetical protein